MEKAMNAAMRAAAVVACALALAGALALGAGCGQAWAYFDRGSVEVELGATTVDVEAGETMSVSVSLTPSSDEQTEGCGMPRCPQSCSEDCMDDNGQCTCAGSEYATYHATATASSSDSSVAVAVYSSGTLTIYGKAEGTATVTVTASLRQFTDGQASVTVNVTGSADGADGGDAEVELPEEADAEQEDRADVVVKELMKGTMRFVRITDDVDVLAALSDQAGVEGELTFWSGDTYYHPVYSLTFMGDEYGAGDVFDFDPSIEVLTEAEGTAGQLLAGLDGFVVAEFAHDGALPAEATVYIQVDVFADGDEVALYSYDADAMAFVLEDAEVEVTGGYAVFAVDEAKVYVVSSHDLTTEANAVADGDATDGSTGSSSAVTLPITYAAIVIVALAAVLLVIGWLALRRRGGKDVDDDHAAS